MSLPIINPRPKLYNDPRIMNYLHDGGITADTILVSDASALKLIFEDIHKNIDTVMEQNNSYNSGVQSIPSEGAKARYAHTRGPRNRILEHGDIVAYFHNKGVTVSDIDKMDDKIWYEHMNNFVVNG